MKQGQFSSDDVEPPSPGGTYHVRQPETISAYTNHYILIKSSRRREISLASRLRSSPLTSAFRKEYFSDATITEWNDWRWQLRHRFRDMETLSRVLVLSEDELRAVAGPSRKVPVAITPYYASLLESEAIRRAVVPTRAEHAVSFGERADPLGEESDSPVPGLVHRYPDRVLFLVTNSCATHCRYCTRSRILAHAAGPVFNKAQWEMAIAYIEATPAVRDVLLSGGDPLTLRDEQLEWLLQRLRKIPHVELLRIGTKCPVVLPQRITRSLTQILKRYHPLWVSIHFTHPDELTLEVFQACERLADAGIPLGSQTVLLAGINDEVATMKELFHGLLKMRVRPYYLYQCDPILGSAHFRTSVERGLEIMQSLRGHTSGYAVPTYVIDAPGGGGKIPLLPEYVIGRDGENILLRNYERKTYCYPDTASKGTSALTRDCRWNYEKDVRISHSLRYGARTTAVNTT